MKADKGDSVCGGEGDVDTFYMALYYFTNYHERGSATSECLLRAFEAEHHQPELQWKSNTIVYSPMSLLGCLSREQQSHRHWNNPVNRNQSGSSCHPRSPRERYSERRIRAVLGYWLGPNCSSL